MKNKFSLLFRGWVGGWLIYLPYYFMMTANLYVGYLLLHLSYHITYWQILGFVIALRITRGLIVKQGNLVSENLLRDEIAQAAFTEGYAQGVDSRGSKGEFKKWWKNYRKTL